MSALLFTKNKPEPSAEPVSLYSLTPTEGGLELGAATSSAWNGAGVIISPSSILTLPEPLALNIKS